MHHYLPAFPLQLSAITLFGATLLLGLIGGALAKKIRFFPKILGYIMIGFLLGPNALNLISSSVLANVRLFVDISLGLILFELGRQLDFQWLREDRGLACSGLAESSLTFVFILLFGHYFVMFTWLQAALAASFAMATSPAVVLLVANDLHAEGPVTRRTQALTSINNFFALTIFTFLLPMTQSSTLPTSKLWQHSCYLLLGSALVGLLAFLLTYFIGKLIGKDRGAQFSLFVGALILTIGIAQIFHTPVALTLFIFGVATRNLDRKHRLMEIDFGWSSQLFFILLFVVTGTYLRLDGLQHAAVAILLFIVVRSFSKTLGVFLFSKKSGITKGQIIAISLALTPMAGLAISMSNVLDEFNPDINRQIAQVMAAVVGILEILGPIATQVAFIKSKETLPDRTA